MVEFLLFTRITESFYLWSRILKSRELLGEFGKGLPDGTQMAHYSCKVIKQHLGGLFQLGDKMVEEAVKRCAK